MDLGERDQAEEQTSLRNIGTEKADVVREIWDEF